MPTPSMLQSLSKKWWHLLLRGILAIVFGVMAFTMPGLTLLTLALLYGVYAFIDGALAVWLGASSHGWALAFFGLIGIVVGMLTVIIPSVTAIALLYLIGTWAILRGMFEILTAVQLRHEITNEWSLGLAGAISIAFGLLLFVRPGTGALAVVWLIGAYAVVQGVLLIKLAFRVRGLPERMRNIPHAA